MSNALYLFHINILLSYENGSNVTLSVSGKVKKKTLEKP